MEAKLDFIFTRRSIRKFIHKPLDKETIELLLKAAMSAPSAAAKDPWRFIVVQERQTLQEMAQILPHGRMLAEASAGILVLGDLSSAYDNKLSYLLQDCSAAIENLLLAASALSLGGCWLGVHPREDRVKLLQEKFLLPENLIPVSALAIGWPAETPSKRHRYNSSYVHWEHL